MKKIFGLALIVSLTLALLAQATVTGSYRASVAPNEPYEWTFTPTAPGPVRVHVELRPLRSMGLGAALYAQPH